jgi:hypothetical protein
MYRTMYLNLGTPAWPGVLQHFETVRKRVDNIQGTTSSSIGVSTFV